MKRFLLMALFCVLAFLGGTFSSAAFNLMNPLHPLSPLNPIYDSMPPKSSSSMSLVQAKNLVRRISKGMYAVNAIFKRDDLTGVVITSRSGKRLLGWLVNAHLFLGSLYDKTGRDITALEAKRRKAQHPVEAVLAMKDAAESPPAVSWDAVRTSLAAPLKGTEAFPPALYMFTWSGCPTCRAVGEVLKELAPARKIGVRLIPVGGSPATDRDGAKMLGRKVDDVRQGLRSNAELLENLAGQLRVLCLVWRGPEGTVEHRLMNRRSDIERLLDALRDGQSAE